MYRPLMYYTILVSILIFASESNRANAGLITVNETMDISGFTAPFDSLVKTLSTPVTISPGDTIDLTVNFLPGQAFQVFGPAQLFAVGLTSNVLGPYSTMNDTETFLGFSGSPGTGNSFGGFSPTFTFGNSGPGVVMQSFVPNSGDMIQFTGFHFVFDILAIPVDPVTQTNLVIVASSAQSVAVPEPSVLMLSGIGMIGMAIGAIRRCRMSVEFLES